MPRHEGLKFVPINVRALGYQCALLPGSVTGVNPAGVSEETAREFRKVTSGIQVYVKLPAGLNGATSPGAHRTYLKAALARHVRAARALRVAALVIPPTPCPFNGEKPYPFMVENRLKDFYALNWEPDDPMLLFQLGRTTPANAGFLAPIIRDLGVEKAGFALDPATFADMTPEELETCVQIFLDTWGELTKAAIVDREGWPPRVLTALAAAGPVLLDLQTLMGQTRLADLIRGEVDGV